MISKALLKRVRLSPQKARVVAKDLRGKKVELAVDNLKFSNTKASKIILKVLESAISNAEQNPSVDIDLLKISKINVDKGPTMKRFMTRAKGRSNRILKPTSHILIELS